MVTHTDHLITEWRDNCPRCNKLRALADRYELNTIEELNAGSNLYLLLERTLDLEEALISRQLRDIPPPPFTRDSQLVSCAFCHQEEIEALAHRHADGWVCEECWDERLRATE